MSERCFDAAFKALQLLNSTRPTWNGPIHRAAALLLEATGPQAEVKHADATSRRKKLLEDCLVMLVSLVLTEPFQTSAQQQKIPGLIKRLKKEVA